MVPIGQLSNTEIMIEIICAVSSVLIVVVFYPLYMRFSPKGTKKISTKMIMRVVRHQWVETYTGSGLFAINSFRDYLNAGQFFASTAIVIAIGVVGFVYSSSELCIVKHENFSLGECTPQEKLQLAKIGIFILNYLVAFFNFSQCVRYATHCPFLLNVTHIGNKKIPCTIAQRFLERAASYWSSGLHHYYASMALVLWFGGPWLFVCGSIGLTFLLHYAHYLGDEDFSAIIETDTAIEMREVDHQVEN